MSRDVVLPTAPIVKRRRQECREIIHRRSVAQVSVFGHALTHFVLTFSYYWCEACSMRQVRRVRERGEDLGQIVGSQKCPLASTGCHLLVRVHASPQLQSYKHPVKPDSYCIHTTCVHLRVSSGYAGMLTCVPVLHVQLSYSKRHNVFVCSC